MTDSLKIYLAQRNPTVGDINGNLAMIRESRAVAAEAGAGSWAQLFLKYLISHPAVTCPIPGTDDVGHLEDNMGAQRAPLPDQAWRRRVEEYWDGLE